MAAFTHNWQGMDSDGGSDTDVGQCFRQPEAQFSPLRAGEREYASSDDDNPPVTKKARKGEFYP